MKSLKKCLVFVMIAAMLMAFMSCGNAEESKEVEKESVQTKEAEQEEVEEDLVEEEEIPEEDTEDLDLNEEGLSLLDGCFVSTLIGEKDPDMELDPYIESVEIEDGYLVIKGSLQEKDFDDDMDEVDDMDDADDMDDMDDVDDADDGDSEYYEFDTYRFKITEDTEFYSAGGSIGAMKITLDEFVELAHYYNGLGMILEIEDGIVKEGNITS
ncbi:MAG: hypothetical protein MJ097_02780 [Dorea sp.]|nr:hypothetical protein [Dorea sp.]